MSGLRFGLSLSMQGRDGKAWKPSDLFETGSGFLYDFSLAYTLFQEATGITPAGVDQNVGLALDISRWGGKTLAQVLAGQPEKVTNGGFDADANWTKGTGWTISGGVASFSNPTGTVLRQAIPTTVGKTYEISLDLAYISGSGIQVQIATPGGTASPVFASSGRKTCRLTAAASYANFDIIGIGNSVLSVDNVSIKEIPGNHASQATSGARPVLKAGGLTRYDGSDDGLVMTVNPSAATTFLVEGKLPSSNSRYFGGVNGAGTSRLYLGTNSDVLAALVGSGTALLGTAALSESGVFGVMNDGTTASLIQNGAIVASQAQAGAPTTAFPIALGFVNNSGTPAGWGNSDIYKALAINRALTPAEIVKLTNYWNTH